MTLGACGSDTDAARSSPDANAPTDPPTAPATTNEPVTVREHVEAPALAGNLLGDPAELDVSIRLPASYDTETRSYPVVYFLGGYGEMTRAEVLGLALDDLVAEGASPEMIIVSVSGTNSMGGSFYVDSPVTGSWAEAIHRDLVSHIDRTYRTIASRTSRGVAGFSMGGFGALDLAMRHSDVFGAVYALSPGLFDGTGLESSQMFADQQTIQGFLSAQAELMAMDDVGPEDVRRTMAPDADVRFAAAYGMAFSPAPEAGPPWIDYPYEAPGTSADESIWQRWQAGYGGIDDELAEFADDLRTLRAIVIDVGTADEYAWIPAGCRYYASAAERHGIPVRLELFEGGHGGIGARSGEIMWPMFAEVLDA